MSVEGGASRRWETWVPAAWALFPALLLAFAPLADGDVWFHLATGRLIASTHAIPRTDPFSFTASGEPWIAHEWLWELVAWGLWRVGPWALIGLRVLAGAGGLLATWETARVVGASSTRAAVATAWLSFAVARRFAVRPQMLTLVGFALLLLLLEIHRAGRPRPLRLAIGPLFLVWANGHAGVLYGLVLLAYELGWDVLDHAWGRARELAFFLAVALAVVLVLTPFGWRGLVYPVELLQLNSLLDLTELRPLASFLGDPTFWPSAAALALGAVASVAQLRRDRRGAIRTLAMIGAAFWHVRGIDLAAVSAIPVLAAALQALTVKSERRLLALGSTLAMLVSLAWLDLDPSRRPGAAVDWSATPKGAVDFLARNHVTGLGYNSEPLGGYLLFAAPERPVFIDGRDDPYAKLVAELVNGLDPFARWPMTYGVATYSDARLGELRRHLPLAWFDDVCQIAASGPPDLATPCLLPEGPFLALGAPPDACLAQAQRVARESPRSWRAAVLEAAALSKGGQQTAADRALDRGTEADAAPPREALEEMRDLALALGQSGEERASALAQVAQRSGDPADQALASLARGDCAPWKALIARRPALRNWEVGRGSPVAALLDAACP